MASGNRDRNVGNQYSQKAGERPIWFSHSRACDSCSPMLGASATSQSRSVGRKPWSYSPCPPSCSVASTADSQIALFHAGGQSHVMVARQHRKGMRRTIETPPRQVESDLLQDSPTQLPLPNVGESSSAKRIHPPSLFAGPLLHERNQTVAQFDSARVPAERASCPVHAPRAMRRRHPLPCQCRRALAGQLHDPLEGRSEDGKVPRVRASSQAPRAWDLARANPRTSSSETPCAKRRKRRNSANSRVQRSSLSCS